MSFPTSWDQCTVLICRIVSIQKQKRKETIMTTTEVSKKIRTRKATAETRSTFKFTQTKLEQSLFYKGNGKAPDKRFDEGCESLCLFIYPNNQMTFYAVAKKPMFNEKKGRMENNSYYKKMFPFSKIKPNGYEDCLDKARSLVKDYVALILDPGLSNDQTTFGNLAQKFLDEGMNGNRLSDKAEKHNYKKSTIKKYTKLINTYILLRSNNPEITKRMSEMFPHKSLTSTKPIKDVACSNINEWEIDVLHNRLKKTPVVANDVLKVVSIIINWGKQNKKFNGPNPCNDIAKFPEKKIKARLSDEQREKILNHCKSKAFDYDPFFLAFIALLLLLGKRIEELLSVTWNIPYTNKEKETCSGWLDTDWERSKYLILHDTKNRKDERVYLESDSRAILQRLQAARLTEKNSWALTSRYLFPQKNDPTKACTSSSFRKSLKELNEKLNLSVIVKDEKTKVITQRLGFTFKLARKTFGSWVEENFGLEIASKKLNHSSTKVTRDHYIVSEDRQLEIENVYQNKREKEDIIKGVIVNTKKLK